MYKRYYDGYGTYDSRKSTDAGEVIIPRQSDQETILNTAADEKNVFDKAYEEKPDTESCQVSAPSSVAGILPFSGSKKLSNSFALDDLILIGVILLVLKDTPDDTLLIVILAAIFLLGLFD